MIFLVDIESVLVILRSTGCDTDTDCLPSAEAQSFEDEWQQKVSVKAQPFGPGRLLEEPRSRVAPMAAITGPEQANRSGHSKRLHNLMTRVGHS